MRWQAKARKARIHAKEENKKPAAVRRRRRALQLAPVCHASLAGWARAPRQLPNGPAAVRAAGDNGPQCVSSAWREGANAGAPRHHCCR